MQIGTVWRSQGGWRTCRTSSLSASKTMFLAAAPNLCVPIICPDFWGSCPSSGLCAPKASNASFTWNWKTWFLLLRSWRRYSWTLSRSETGDRGEPKLSTQTSSSITWKLHARKKIVILRDCALKYEMCRHTCVKAASYSTDRTKQASSWTKRWHHVYINSRCSEQKHLCVPVNCSCTFLHSYETGNQPPHYAPSFEAQPGRPYFHFSFFSPTKPSPTQMFAVYHRVNELTVVMAMESAE